MTEQPWIPELDGNRHTLDTGHLRLSVTAAFGGWVWFVGVPVPVPGGVSVHGVAMGEEATLDDAKSAALTAALERR